MQTEEIHPFKHFIPAGSKTLLIGTFPPSRRNWSFEFFYPNKQNLFWKIIAAIAGTTLQHFEGNAAVDERKDLLQQLRAGITDMGLVILRTHQSSLDEDIAVQTFMDIFKLLDDHPSIAKLIFTSSSGKSSAAGWFQRYLKQQNIVHRFASGPKPLHSELRYKERTIELVILYSPSPRAANRISFDEMVQMYRTALIVA